MRSFRSMELDKVASGMPAPAHVAAIEAAMLAMPQRQIEITHALHGGMYARTGFIPRGTAVTGGLASKDNICLVMGDITVTTDDGPRRITGFAVLPSMKGSKRIGIAHEDTWWTTIIKTDAANVHDAEDDMTPESERLQSRRPVLVLDEVSKARLDYQRFLVDCEIPQEFVDAALKCTTDLVVTDLCLVNVELGESPIEGLGLFATRELGCGAVIAPARIGGKRCVAGRRTNHSHDPNSVAMPTEGGDMVMVATRRIVKGEEITLGYRQAFAAANENGG